MLSKVLSRLAASSTSSSSSTSTSSDTSTVRYDECIGRGGFGTVLRSSSNYSYALKVGRQLEHEAHVMHMLSGHRNIVDYVQRHSPDPYLLDVIQQQQQEEEEMEEEEEEIECIQMQLCSGPPLNEFIRTLQRELTVQELVLVLWDMLLGIQHIHENNIVHRDIKPDNLIFHHKVLKYIDFGLSFVLSEGDANSKDLGVGTPIYAAPEQLKGEYPAFAADVFSLGMVLFELMSRFKTDMERAIAMMNFRNRVLLYQNPNPQCGFLMKLAYQMTESIPQNRPSVPRLIEIVFQESLSISGSWFSEVYDTFTKAIEETDEYAI